MMAYDCCLTGRLQIDGRRMTVHSAVQRTASGGIPTRYGVLVQVVLVRILLLLVRRASDASAINPRLAPHINILEHYLLSELSNLSSSKQL